MKVAVSVASPDCSVLILDKDDNPVGELSAEVGNGHFDLPEGGLKLVPVEVKPVMATVTDGGEGISSKSK